MVGRQILLKAALIEITQYELGCIGRQSVKFLCRKYSGRLDPRWLWVHVNDDDDGNSGDGDDDDDDDDDYGDDDNDVNIGNSTVYN